MCACDRESMEMRNRESEIFTLSTEVRYYKDTRSNLCFAGMDISTTAQTVTNVPCTPEVEKVVWHFSSPK